ncbi:MAG: hypothetical protein ABUL49_01625 [bacterium]
MSFQADDWLPHALLRLSSLEPDRYEQFVSEFKAALPSAYAELIALAQQAGKLDPDLAERMKIATLNLEASELVVKDERGVARIIDSNIAVWEIVRAFRKVGSVTALKEGYAGLSERELRTALAYYGQNPDEISAQIAKYEETRIARQAYPHLAVSEQTEKRA